MSGVVSPIIQFSGVCITGTWCVPDRLSMFAGSCRFLSRISKSSP